MIARYAGHPWRKAVAARMHVAATRHAALSSFASYSPKPTTAPSPRCATEIRLRLPTWHSGRAFRRAGAYGREEAGPHPRRRRPPLPPTGSGQSAHRLVPALADCGRPTTLAAKPTTLPTTPAGTARRERGADSLIIPVLLSRSGLTGPTTGSTRARWSVYCQPSRHPPPSRSVGQRSPSVASHMCRRTADAPSTE